jgi:hypothetical protein
MARSLAAGPSPWRRRALYAAALVVLGLVLTLISGNWRIGIGAAVLLGGGLIMVLDPPSRTDADRWKQGAAGEQATASLLRPLTRRGYTVLHDRALGNSRANVDHLVIGPHGVAILDSKNWNKNTRIRARGGHVWVGRTHGDKVVSGLQFEREKVASVLRAELGVNLAVPALLVIHGAKLPPWRTYAINGIPLLQGRAVRRWIRNLPSTHDAETVAALAAICERRFPPYVRPA